MSDTMIPVWTLGDRLAKARKLAGFSTAAMAGRLGVTDKTIRNWESGFTTPPDGQVIAYAAVCKVDLAWLEGTAPEQGAGDRRAPRSTKWCDAGTVARLVPYSPPLPLNFRDAA